jgi:hypothetical protein
MKVTEIGILSSQTGDGLKVGNKTIGCAKVTKVELAEGATLTDCAKDGLCLGYSPEGDYQASEPPTYGIRIVLNAEDLTGSSNYVLFIRDNESGATSVVVNTTDITDLFGLPRSDAETLERYLGVLAQQRQLELMTYTNMDDDTEGMFFVNSFDREINELVLDAETDAAEAVQSYVSAQNNAEFMTQLRTDNFIKMFLMTVVQTGQDRFNRLYRDMVIEAAAAKLSSVRYYADGVLTKPSVKDINDMVIEMTKHIKIEQ